MRTLGLWICVFSGWLGLVESHAQTSSFEDEVVVVRVQRDDLDDSRKIRDWEKLLSRIEDDGARAVVFDLDVKGDIEWDLQERILESLSNLTVPSIAFVNSSATGAGALIAVGSDDIYMSNSGIIGGAGIRLAGGEDSKALDRELAQQLSLLKARARSLAKVRGHRSDIAEAFIDSEIEIVSGENVISKKGEVLTLTAEEAMQNVEGQPLLAKGTASKLEEVLEKEDLGEATVETTPGDFVRELNRERLKQVESETEAEGGESVESDEPNLFSKRTGESYGGKIVIIEIGMDALSSGKARFDFMDRTLKKAQLDGAGAVIFDIDTPGGFAWYTQGLLLNSLQDITIPTYAFVNTRAESAGAIVALGADHIYMRPAASIGSALVVTGVGGDLSSAMESKQTQMIISVVRNIAELKGHNPDIAEAFVTRDKEVKIGGTVIHEKGEVLNLNTIQATEVIDGRPVLAKGIAGSLEDIVKQEELSGEIIEAQSLGLESFAHWIQKLAPLLIIVGIAGVYLEIQSPGLGLPGLIGLTAFILYFFGNNLAGNLAGYELVVLFVLGLLLILVEVFLFPGTLIPSLLGALLVITSLALSMVDRVDLAWKWDGMPGSGTWMELLRSGFISMSLGLLGGVVLVLALMRFFPKTPFGNLLILNQAVPGGASLQTAGGSGDEESGPVSYVGWVGEAVTDLRPSGKGRFRGKQLDIISDGEFISRGEFIEVAKHEGSRIVVKRAEKD